MELAGAYSELEGLPAPLRELVSGVGEAEGTAGGTTVSDAGNSVAGLMTRLAMV